MALISAKTIITSLSLFHITLAWFFFTSPRTIADQAMVYVLGEAMGMPQTTSFNAPSPPLSLLAMLLLTIGLSDIQTLSMPEEIWLLHYWLSQAPLRLLVFFVLTIYSFLTSPSTRGPGRLSHPVVVVAAPGLAGAEGGGWDGLRNRVVFTLAFLELISWFWVWVTLKEEGQQLVKRRMNRDEGEQWQR